MIRPIINNTQVTLSMIDTIIVSLLLLCLSFSVRVDPTNSLFVDQYGRYTVYHGVNAVYKTFPFYPETEHFDTNYSLTDRDLYNLKSWGMNVIRLHAAWEGIQPQRGVYNYSYVEKLREIVRSCNKFGIMVLLDAHQDLFVKQFCGEGLPTWVAKRKSFPAPLNVTINFDPDGFPNREDCLKIPFSEFYLTYDVMQLQHDIFTNQRGLLDHLCQVWQILAVYMSSEPNIMGYQFLNEPIGANAYRDPSGAFLPGASNNQYLLPAYKRIYSAIRKWDKRNLVFFEPSIIDVFGSGFIETPGGEAQLELQVFSYHVYCPDVTKLGEPKSTKFCEGFDALTVGSKEANVRSLRVGGFLTEYGALSGTEKSAKEIETITDLLAEHFRSWTYWQFKYYNDITTMASPGTTESFYDEFGNLQLHKVKALARPYASAICGVPLLESFENALYSLTWVASNHCFNQDTQLFLSDAFYFPRGFKTHFQNCPDCKVVSAEGSEDNYYRVKIGPKGTGRRVRLRISAL